MAGPRVSSKQGQERVNAQHSMKQALQGVKIFAQEPTLGIFRLFAVLQHIPNSTADRKDLQQSCKMAALARNLCLPIPAILVLITAGTLANYFLEGHRAYRVLIGACRA